MLESKTPCEQRVGKQVASDEARPDALKVGCREERSENESRRTKRIRQPAESAQRAIELS
jgi:hypothetical protein